VNGRVEHAHHGIFTSSSLLRIVAVRISRAKARRSGRSDAFSQRGLPPKARRRPPRERITRA
jgi:hypothetical protein